MKQIKPTCAPRTAVAYARYSSAGQRDVSIEQQLHDIRAYAAREGFNIIHEYADHARSGYKRTESRTAFQQMLSAVDSGAFDTVLVWKVDRFGRSREDSAVYKGRLRRRGVRVVYVMEPIPDGSAGVLLEGMLEATAEWYSVNLSENVKRGMDDNASRCLYNGTRVYGYACGPALSDRTGAGRRRPPDLCHVPGRFPDHDHRPGLERVRRPERVREEMGAHFHIPDPDQREVYRRLSMEGFPHPRRHARHYRTS